MQGFKGVEGFRGFWFTTWCSESRASGQVENLGVYPKPSFFGLRIYGFALQGYKVNRSRPPLEKGVGLWLRRDTLNPKP